MHVVRDTTTRVGQPRQGLANGRAECDTRRIEMLFAIASRRTSVRVAARSYEVEVDDAYVSDGRK
jgi:hypothetical protein